MKPIIWIASSKTGIHTSQQDKELLHARLKQAERLYAQWLVESKEG